MSDFFVTWLAIMVIVGWLLSAAFLMVFGAVDGRKGLAIIGFVMATAFIALTVTVGMRHVGR